MFIKIEKVSPDQVTSLKKMLEAIPQGVLGSLETITYNSFQPIGKVLEVKLYLERNLGSHIQHMFWPANFEDKQECEIAAEHCGYRSFAALLADTRNKFVEKIVIS